jgi:hypothetical protein
MATMRTSSYGLVWFGEAPPKSLIGVCIPIFWVSPPKAMWLLFKSAVASVLDPDPLLIQAYAESTNQECPLEETPVERLKRALPGIH